MECNMCGDVGIADSLFQCNKCRFRYQHRYCSKAYFYGGFSEAEEEYLCDWCFVKTESTSDDDSGSKVTKIPSVMDETSNGKSKSSSSGSCDALNVKESEKTSLKGKIKVDRKLAAKIKRKFKPLREIQS